MKTDDIYIITAGEYFKLGRSNKPEQRKRELQTGCPHRLIIKCIYSGIGSYENKIHKALSKYKVNGGTEWFDISGIDRAIQICEKLNSKKPIERYENITWGGKESIDGRLCWTIDVVRSDNRPPLPYESFKIKSNKGVKGVKVKSVINTNTYRGFYVFRCVI